MRQLETNYGTMVEVKRKRDAEAIYCEACNWFEDKLANPYWTINQSAWMHKDGTGHKVRFYGWPKEKP